MEWILIMHMWVRMSGTSITQVFNDKGSCENAIIVMNKVWENQKINGDIMATCVPKGTKDGE